MQYHGVGIPSMHPGTRLGGVRPVMMPMMRPQFQLWGGAGPRMQARPMMGYMMPSVNRPIHRPLPRLDRPLPRLDLPRAGHVRKPVPKARAPFAGVKKINPTVAKAPSEAPPSGVKRKLDTAAPPSSQPSKFVRGPPGAGSSTTAIPKVAFPKRGVVKAEISNGTPKPSGAMISTPKAAGWKPNPKVAAVHPYSLQRSAKAAPSVASDSAPSREHRDPALIKAEVQMRKVEGLTKQLLREWSSLAEDRKEESWKAVATSFKERVPSAFLESMIECFTGSTPAKPNSDAEPEQLVKTEVNEDDPANFESAMQEVFNAMAEKELEELVAFWATFKISKSSTSAALTVFLQIVVMDCGDAQNAASLLQQLLTAKLISTSSLELALTSSAKKLEELTEANETAWHVHAHVIMKLFPKTAQSSWGYSEKSWNWWIWWQMAHRTLNSADSFRAFDILVLVLQMMQEQSGLVVREQLAWKDQGRIKRVRDTLCGWGDMDETALVETLTAYGVEL